MKYCVICGDTQYIPCKELDRLCQDCYTKYGIEYCVLCGKIALENSDIFLLELKEKSHLDKLKLISEKNPKFKYKYREQDKIVTFRVHYGFERGMFKGCYEKYLELMDDEIDCIINLNTNCTQEDNFNRNIVSDSLNGMDVIDENGVKIKSDDYIGKMI